MTHLSVNLNKIALIRNARSLDIPNVIKAAKTCIAAGAYGITIHPRPDERHIRYSDVYDLKPVVSSVEYNIEGNPFTGKFMDLMPDIRPTQATLVPDMPGAITSDHGWDLNPENCQRLIPVINKLKSLGIRASLFVDPVIETVEMAKKIGADRIELYTEPFASAFASKKNLESLTAKFAAAAKHAAEIGLGVNAGHDLSLDNLGFFCKNVKPVMEVSIGHALIADAIDMGLSDAVKEYIKILEDCG
ncbi:MAG: pyridoxine 5'-phosphate synthase [Planctomycetes bacterium GWF2_42_9]|nr:MAG: pyridoxine 5'-phosphate synthase [Planctomycetes bacterium GWF2_42_9]HAL46006.1 pyridoxine 5'-phosphate synthase [Phycisphaerales bacterium]